MLPTRSADALESLLQTLNAHLDLKWPLMAWYAAPSPPDGTIRPPMGAKTCLYAMRPAVTAGQSVGRSADQPGCTGAAGDLGFRPVKPGAGRFLARREHFKQTESWGQAFYRRIPAPTGRRA